MKKINEHATAARFLLGGIGTGNISVDQNGRLTDFEFRNSPGKGFRGPYTFFAVHTKDEDGATCTRALESEFQPPFNHSHGFHAWETAGLPRFRHSQMWGEYPFVHVTLEDATMPVSAELEAFTPFIPLNTDDSSLPGAVLRYRLRNTSNKVQNISVAGSCTNLCNFTEENIWTKALFEGVSKNTFVRKDHCWGIHFSTESKKPTDLHYMEMAMMTTGENVTWREYWNEGSWWDGLQDFWNDLTEDGALDRERALRGTGNQVHVSDMKVASLCVQQTLAPGEEGVFEFLLTWYHPNRLRSWDQSPAMEATGRETIRNYYAKFGPALDTAEYLATQLPRLEGDSRKFREAMYSSSYPDYVIDAVASTITVLRSNTCFRVEDGTFFAFEGQFDGAGCCDGSCTHVWNYAQTIAFLFPELERSMRQTEFLTETKEDGAMDFRARKYLLDPSQNMPCAADGQMGCIIRLYRDWQLSGDDAFLRKLWPNAKKALEYAFTHWDVDGDGIMEGQQHNTYDIEFYGPNSMMNSLYYTALRAGEEMARYLGQTTDADRYADIRTRGAALLDAETFNGEYYEQNIDDVDKYKYQYGKGCLADQLFGQQLAHINGLGYVLDDAHVKSAVKAIFDHNFLTSFDDHCNLQRTYALNDEAGLLLCTWPRGGRPEIPFVYCDEVWTGIEYQVAAHLIYEGFVDEGLAVTKAVRDRHDGVRRSPWNEVECGHHYARSLASYGVLLALSGFHCDAVNKILRFEPKNPGDHFTSFFSCGDGWGVYRRTMENGKRLSSVEVLYGSLDGYTLVADGISTKI